MNSPLSYIAGFLVFLLFVLLIVPSLIDWNDYRDQFEKQASEMTGREVKIGGDISFSIFPAPHLKVAAMRVANVENGREPFFAKFDQVEAEVALLPLLRGKMSVTSVHVLHPEFHFEVFADGKDNWGDFFMEKPLPDEGMFSLGSIQLDKASFERGIVTYTNAKSGRNWQLTNMQGEVVATSLLGPVNADLSFDIQNVPFAMRIAIGNYSSDQPFPLTAEMSMRNEPARFLFTGTTTGFSSGAHVAGTGSFEFGNMNGANGNKGAYGTDEELKEKAHAPVRVEAKIIAADGAATFDDLNIGMSGTTLKGSAKAQWNGRPRVDITLAAQTLTLDSITDRMRDMRDKDETKPFAPLLVLPLPDWFDLALGIKVDGLLVHDVLVKDARVDARLKDGALTLEQGTGEIGGNTRFSLKGTLSQDDKKAKRFDGMVDAASKDIAALAAWLQALREETGVKAGAKPAVAPIASSGKPFSIASRVALTPESIQFSDIRAAFAAKPDPAATTGFVRYLAEGGRSLVAARLDAETLDLDALLALLPSQNLKLDDIIGTYDFDVALSAKSLVLREANLKSLSLSASLIKNVLSIRSFEIGDIEGTKISVAGMLSGVEAGKLDGLQGNLTGSLEARDVDPFVRLFAPERFRAGGAASLTLSAASGEADDSQNRLDVFTLQGIVGGSRVDAVVKRRHAADGSSANFDVVANGVNNDGKILLGQLGIAPDMDVRGIASFALQMSGTNDEPANANLRLNANGGTLLAKGSLNELFTAPGFVGHVDVSAPALDLALAAAGLRQNVADFLSAQTRGAGFVLSTDVNWTRQSLTLRAAEGVAGNLHLSGEAVYARAENATPTLNGQLNVNVLDLTPLFVNARPDAAAKPETVWPDTAIDWAPLSAVNGSIGLKAEQLRLGAMNFNQTDGRLNFANGLLTVEPMSAVFADGQASISARFAQPDTGDGEITLDLRINGADFAVASQSAFAAAIGGGRADLDLQLKSQGRSWFALVSSLNGKAMFSLRRGALIPFNLEAFNKGLTQLDTLGKFAALQDASLMRGATPVNGFGGEIIVANGVARMEQKSFELDGGKGSLVASLDLPRLKAKSDMAITPEAPAGAPAFHIRASLDQRIPTRDLDTAALQKFLGTRILAKEVEKAGVLPAELDKLVAPDKAKPNPKPKPQSEARP